MQVGIIIQSQSTLETLRKNPELAKQIEHSFDRDDAGNYLICYPILMLIDDNEIYFHDIEKKQLFEDAGYIFIDAV